MIANQSWKKEYNIILPKIHLKILMSNFHDISSPKRRGVGCMPIQIPAMLLLSLLTA